MNKYLKFEYWNTCDLGNIYYQGGQHFIFYLDADVGEPIHEEVEEGQENGDGDFIPTYRRQMKRYRIRTGLIPDYLIDAIQRMKLHDHIELTFKSGEVEQIYNVDVEPEWQFEKYAWQGTMTLTFDMDESITVGACCDNLVVQNHYWVAETGSDISGDGTYANPWATLAYACTQATTPGDVIHVKAGTITETVQSNLAVGVSIIGAGVTSIILSHVDGTRGPGGITGPTISLQSTTQGTDGNQSISYIKMDGDGLIGDIGIYVKYRNNVKIHHCTIEDFYISGIIYQGGSASNVEPTTYMTDGEIHNCTITNCGDEAGTWNGGGALNISGTDGFLVYDNVITNIARTAGVNGNIMNGGYYNKGLKYYRNKSYKPDDNTQWNFHIEHWNGLGGIEIYDNEFYGGNVALDIAGFFNVKGSYDYAWSVHNNLFTTYSGGYATATSDKECVLVEGPDNEDIYIYRNLFEKIPCPLSIKCRVVGIASNIRAYYNIMSNCGINSAANFSNLFRIALTVESPIVFSDIYILNNIIKGDNVTRNMMVVGTAAGTTINGLYIRNNIIMDTDNGAFLAVTNTGTMDGLYIDNNCLYGNPNTNNPSFTGNAVTNYTFNDNVKDDPDFVGGAPFDFHLQAGSPCINKGIDVGLTTDYDGQAVSDPPEIGAYEY